MKSAEIERNSSLGQRLGGLDEELDPCVVLSPRMDVLYVNPAAKKIVPSSWIGRPCWQTFPVVEQIYGTSSSVARSIRRSCESLFCVERIISHGKRHDYGVAIVPLTGSGGGREIHESANALLVLRRKEDDLDATFESRLVHDGELIRARLMPWILAAPEYSPQPRKQNRVSEFFRNDSLFRSVSEAALQRLVQLARVQSLKKGSFLYTMGQPASELYFLMEGSAHVILIEKDGRERILYTASPGDMVGAIAFFDQQPYPCTLRVERDSKFIQFDRAELLALLQQESELLLEILGGLIRRQREIVHLLEEMTFVGTSGRLWNYLLQNSKSENQQFPRTLERLPTREKIAGSIGTVREVVSRGLSRLVASGHISIEGRRLTIHKALSPN
jgi:CRP/FNR family transcriptional regulator